jgi:hypothetical protein
MLLQHYSLHELQLAIIPYMSFNLPGTALFSLGFDFPVLRMSNIFQLVRNCEYGLRFPT